MTTRDLADDVLESTEQFATDEPAHQYLRIRPTDDSLAPDTFDSNVRRVHALTGSESSDSLLDRLREKERRPTIECLLVSRGKSDATITYAFGIDDPGGLDSLEQALRLLLPDSYELSRGPSPTHSIDGLDRPEITDAIAADHRWVHTRLESPQERREWVSEGECELPGQGVAANG